MNDLEVLADSFILLENKLNVLTEENKRLDDKLTRLNALQERLVLMNVNLYKENEKLKKNE